VFTLKAGAKQTEHFHSTLLNTIELGSLFNNNPEGCCMMLNCFVLLSDIEVVFNIVERSCIHLPGATNLCNTKNRPKIVFAKFQVWQACPYFFTK